MVNLMGETPYMSVQDPITLWLEQAYTEGDEGVSCYWEYTIDSTLATDTEFLLRLPITHGIPPGRRMNQATISVIGVGDTQDGEVIYSKTRIGSRIFFEETFTVPTAQSYKIRCQVDGDTGGTSVRTEWFSIRATSGAANGIVSFYTFDSKNNINYFNPEYLKTGEIITKTKDMDFGQPGRIKKIYAIYVTYKSVSVQSAPLSYSTDGGTNFTNLTGTFTDTTEWTVDKFYPSSPIECQSIRFKMTNNQNPAIIDINDMAIEYNTIHRKVS